MASLTRRRMSQDADTLLGAVGKPAERPIEARGALLAGALVCVVHVAAQNSR